MIAIELQVSVLNRILLNRPRIKKPTDEVRSLEPAQLAP